MVSSDTMNGIVRERDQQLLKDVLALYEGRAVLYAFIIKGCLYEPISADYGLSQRQLGRRDLVLEVLDEIWAVDENAYIRMQNEFADFLINYSVTGEEDDHD